MGMAGQEGGNDEGEKAGMAGEKAGNGEGEKAENGEGGNPKIAPRRLVPQAARADCGRHSPLTPLSSLLKIAKARFSKVDTSPRRV